jgi:DNA replication protein DnaC
MKCQALRNIPDTKRDFELELILSKYDDMEKRSLVKKAVLRYFDANIPVKYWQLEVNRDFKGDKSLFDFYKNITTDLNESYRKGAAYCFAGKYGLGKTMVITNILKRALEKGFSGIYVNLGDIVSAMKSNESFIARRELLKTDFVMIDEFDPRYMATDSASDFYGRVLEDVLRNRSQNKLPIFMCTNSHNPVSGFNGAIQESITSLMNYVKVIPVLGKDFRIQEGNNV